MHIGLSNYLCQCPEPLLKTYPPGNGPGLGPAQGTALGPGPGSGLAKSCLALCTYAYIQFGLLHICISPSWFHAYVHKSNKLSVANAVLFVLMSIIPPGTCHVVPSAPKCDWGFSDEARLEVHFQRWRTAERPAPFVGRGRRLPPLWRPAFGLF